VAPPAQQRGAALQLRGVDRVFAGAVVAHGGQASRDVDWRLASVLPGEGFEESWPRSGKPQMVRTMRLSPERAEHDAAVLQGRAMPELERLFREHHERVPRRLSPLYEC
jgi:hypothetical protein